MKKLFKLKESDSVLIKDIIRYRFSSGLLGAGMRGNVVRVVENQNCAYIEIPELNNEILWYDLSEIEVT